MKSATERMGKVFHSLGGKSASLSQHEAICEMLGGTWEINLSGVSKITKNVKNDVTNFFPMVNISSDMRVTLMPLTDELKIEAITKYLSSIQLSTDSNVKIILISDEMNGSELDNNNDNDAESYIPIQLVVEMNNSNDNDDQDDNSNNNEVKIVLQGKIMTDEFTLNWNDGSHWQRMDRMDNIDQDGTLMNDGSITSNNNMNGNDNDMSKTPTHDSIDSKTKSKQKSNKKFKKQKSKSQHQLLQQQQQQKQTSEDDFSSMSKHDLISKIHQFKNQLSTLKEKEQMAKRQTQATMAQLADLSNNYADLEKLKKEAESKYFDTHSKLEAAELASTTMKASFERVNDELRQVQGAVVYQQVQEIQVKLTKMKEENEKLKQINSSQQEDIISLRDQLQQTQRTSKVEWSHGQRRVIFFAILFSCVFLFFFFVLAFSFF